MNITPEESKAYQYARDYFGNLGYVKLLKTALRHHVAAEMRLEFEATNHCLTAEVVIGGVTTYRANYNDDDPRHNFTDADWDKAAHEALQKGTE